MNKINPTHHRIIIKPESGEKVRSSGIIIPEHHTQEKPMVGRVASIGPGRMIDGKIVPIDHVSVGDRVVFKQYASMPVQQDGETIYFIDEDDIIGVFEETS